VVEVILRATLFIGIVAQANLNLTQQFTIPEGEIYEKIAIT
jgi:hypothetical protein